MQLASRRIRAVALDLPGVGESTGEAIDGSKRHLARAVRHVIEELALEDVTLVGQDIGGMIAYAYLRQYDDLACGVIMDVVIPGLDPWEEVLRNPYIWHFALHAVPELPERLVQGRQADYFEFFYNAISADPSKITAEARAAYVQAYSSDEALTAGFNWYRAFAEDARHNKQLREQNTTRLLYLRGEHESGGIDAYVTGLRDAGLTHVEYATVTAAGHFTQEEAPHQTWELIADFMDR
jgi:pimeloyl-ACP methyl ester carboxylesterase